MATPPNVTVTLTAEDRGVSQAIQALTQQLQELSVKQREVAATANEASSAEEGMAESMHEARGAAALLGEEVGIKLNRHLRGVLASSETLGPILAAAFPVVAAIGFAEVIAHATEKLTEWISETFIFTKEMKELDAALKSANKEIDENNRKMAENLRAMLLIGQSAEEVARLKSVFAAQDSDASKKAHDDAQARLNDLTKERNELQARAAELEKQPTAEMMGGPEAVPVQTEAGAELEKVQTRLAAIDGEFTKLSNDVALTGSRATIAAQEAEIAEAHHVVAAKDAAEKRAKAEEEAAKRAAAAWQKFLNENNRIMEERAKLAEDEAKFFAGVEEKALIKSSKDLDTRLAAEAKFREESKRNEEQRGIDAISLQQRQIEQEARAREISGADAAAELEALAQKKLDLENKYLDDRIKEISTRMLDEDAASYAKDLEEFTRLLSQKRAAQDKFLADDQKAKQIAADADPLRNLQKSLGKDIERFFTEGIAHAKSFGDAMRGLAESVIASLQKMAAEFLLTAIKKKLLESVGGGEEGGGGGGVLGFLGGMFGLGHAAGGMIEGPGGPKADIIPAMLSAGEFVMSADAVKALGSANLAALNKAAQTPAMGAGTPHFAEGGFTGGDLATSSEINMGIGLDEGLILRHLGSKAAGRVILQQLTNNPKAAARALQRTES